jgi:hypothetical protein
MKNRALAGLAGAITPKGILKSCLSPTFTDILWKKIDAKTNVYRLLYPGFIIVASVISMETVGAILGW